MDSYQKVLSEAQDIARNERVLAVKDAKLELNASIKSAYREAVERAWSAYDLRLKEIWDTYHASLERARNQTALTAGPGTAGSD